jgi:hypothetical protein
VSWGLFNQRFTPNVLRVQIPKAEKTDSLIVFFALLGSACVKAVKIVKVKI